MEIVILLGIYKRHKSKLTVSQERKYFHFCRHKNNYIGTRLKWLGVASSRPLQPRICNKNSRIDAVQVGFSVRYIVV